MRLVKHAACKDLGFVKLDGDQDYPRKSPKGLPEIGRHNQHLFGMVVGGMGYGKTSLILQMLTRYIRTKTYDLIIWVSPTGESDTKVMKVLEKSSAETFVVTNDDVDFPEIIALIDERLERWKMIPQYRRTWRKYQRAQRETDPEKEQELLDQLTDEDLELLKLFDYEPAPSKWHEANPPNTLLVLDDQLGNNRVFSSRMSSIMNRFIVCHRHRRTSVVLSSQSFTQTVPPGIKTAMNFLAVGRCRSQKIQQEIAASFAGLIAPDRFVEAWDTACSSGDHSWFIVSTLTPDAVFRVNLDTVIDVGSE